ncbi:hypothetical protein DSECCO2_634240 [anaerobic digester metagenome]
MKPGNKFDISSSRKKDLGELAEIIADELFPTGIIQPNIIAEKYGITYNCDSYGNYFDGLLECKNGRFHIFLNSDRLKNQYTERARFTLAHELGHYFIDEHRNALIYKLVDSLPSFIDFSSDNIVELEADFFASSLLMPTTRITKDIFKRKFSFELIEEIKNKYQVSLTAALLKFASIGNHPIMIVCSQKERIKWFKYSDDFPFQYIAAEPGFKVPTCSAAGDYHYSNTKSMDNEIVFAEDWFSVYYKQDRKRQFFERCIYSDSSRLVLSIIWEK